MTATTCPICGEPSAPWLEHIEPQNHPPGEAHRYRIKCEVCGQEGTLRLSIEPQTVEENQ